MRKANGTHSLQLSCCSRLSISSAYLIFTYSGKECDQIAAVDDSILVVGKGDDGEHLDNDGLNCAYDNLHIISSDYNKAKAFTIDKERALEPEIPSFITDVYYSHEKQYYQMQVFFNRDVFYNQSNGQPIEELLFQYNDFRSLYVDWVYIYGCCHQGTFDLSTFRISRLYAKNRPIIYLTEDEKDHIFIQRDGQWFLRLNPDGGDKTTFLNKTAYHDVE